MKHIKLYGFLADEFGRDHYRDVADVGEAIVALCCTLPGFEQALVDQKELGFVTFVDDTPIDIKDLDTPVCDKELIKIVPHLLAAKDEWAQIAIGVALVAAAVYSGNWALIAEASWGEAATTTMMMMGSSMIIGGVSQLLAAAPAGIEGSIGNREEQPTYVFSGPINTSAQGEPIGILYGRLRVGSVVGSSGIDTNAFYKNHGAPDELGTMGGNGDSIPWVWAGKPAVEA